MHLMRYIFISILLLVCALSVAQTTAWQDQYKAKKKDTVYGIAHKYGLTVEQLVAANPQMQQEGYQLKKGDIVFIPFATKQTVAKSQTSTEKPIKKDDIRLREVRVGVMLPLHQVDGDGKRMTEYYRGFLLACEDLKSQGISVKVHAWNVAIDADIRQVLLDKAAQQCDVIFGPLYTHQVKYLADFCKTHQIKMVIPFSISSDEVQRNNQIFQVYQSQERLNGKAINAFIERFPDCHPIFVDCNDSTSRKGAFTFGLRKQLEAKGIKYSITNIKSTESQFAKAFSTTQPNVVVLNTGRSPELNVVFAKLNGLKTLSPNLQISLFGYTEWLMYTKYNLANYYRFDTYIPTTFYYNSLSAATQRVEGAYRQWFKTETLQALPRFALTGYDHAMYFIGGLHKYGTTFSGTKKQVVSTPVQTVLYFDKISGGGVENACFQLIHYKNNQTIESVTY